jgi:hypothetical protein
MVKRDGKPMVFYLANNFCVQVVIDNWLETISKAKLLQAGNRVS